MISVPLFSVIMPVYNKEPYIRDTIASVRAQTFSSYEVVMIGGVSSDNTDVICQEFVDKDPDVFRFARQTGKGVSNARNDGILAARGRYVAFLDADDLWVPEYLEVMERLIADFPDAVMYSAGFQRQYPDGQVTTPSIQWKRGYINYFRETSWSTHTSALIVDRQIVLACGLFKTNYPIAEDIDLMIRLALRGKVAYEPMLIEMHLVGLPGSLCIHGAKQSYLPIPGEPEFFENERIPEVILYHEWMILGTAMTNMLHGYRREGRTQLEGVQVNYRTKVCLYKILSYVPTPVFLCLHWGYKFIFRRRL